VGAARSIPGSPERFVPAPVDDLLALLRKRFDSSAESLQRAVLDLDHAPPAPDAFTVRGYERVLEEAERLASSARARIVLSGWPREITQLGGALRGAAKRKVHMVTFSHAALPKVPGEVFSYGLDEAELEAFWKHRLILIADDVRTLIGATERAKDDHAVLSETAAIAEVATSQVALDITLLSQGLDVQAVMARMLGHRVGRLDTLLQEEKGDGTHPEPPIEPERPPVRLRKSSGP
jgi:sugar-specific transcriptional regulator TrmB